MDSSHSFSVAAGTPLCWRTPEAIRALVRPFEAALAQWSCDWSVETGPLEACNAWECAGEGDAASWRCVAQVGEAMLRISCRSGAVLGDAMAQSMFGESLSADPAQAPLARELIAQALAALDQALASALTLQPAASPNCAAPRRPRAWSGDMVASCRLGSERLVLHIDAALLPRREQRVSRPAPTSRAPRASLTEVLGHRTLPLQARLADTEIALRDLVGLRPGDVLVTSHALSDPLALVSQAPNGGDIPVFAAHLVRRGEHMAVSLAAVPESARNSSLERLPA